MQDVHKIMADILGTSVSEKSEPLEIVEGVWEHKGHKIIKLDDDFEKLSMNQQILVGGKANYEGAFEVKRNGTLVLITRTFDECVSTIDMVCGMASFAEANWVGTGDK